MINAADGEWIAATLGMVTLRIDSIEMCIETGMARLRQSLVEAEAEIGAVKVKGSADGRVKIRIRMESQTRASRVFMGVRDGFSQ